MKICAYKINSISYQNSKHFSLVIDNLNIYAGEILGIGGPNGSGKTTLLKILAFLQPPNNGQIELFGEKVDFLNLAPLRKQATMLFQTPLLLKRTVFENVAYGLRIRKNNKDLKKEVFSMLNLLGLPPAKFALRKTSELSSGEAKRVSLAARLILKPKVLLLDEPTENVDEKNADLITNILNDFALTNKKTVIVTSHDKEWLQNISTRIVRLKNGLILK